jgi:hypothetical protein
MDGNYLEETPQPKLKRKRTPRKEVVWIPYFLLLTFSLSMGLSFFSFPCFAFLFFHFVTFTSTGFPIH